ncbi:MAG TPA: NADP-dependent oxidoreductase [Anaerolineales bacterium]|jgi:NADPH:quinone reductase-like Zn-dependent oxidoreductase
MKAVRVNEWGKPVQIEDVPQPEPAKDEALVRVHAASLNPLDAAIMAGYLAYMTSTPMTLGTDFSGEVVEVGSDVSHVKPGDAVYGFVPFRSGTFSEYTTPKVHEVTLKPKSLDHITASTIPLPAMAAWQSLFDYGRFKDGERVLILGVAGAVGGLAAQFARMHGAYIYGTDIPEKAAHAAKLGLDRFIDVNSERFEDVVKDVDLVLDYVGGEYTERSYSVLKAGGRYVTSMQLDTPQEEPKKRGFTSTGFGAQANAELLAKIAGMVDSGKLKVFVNRTFPLQEAQTALDYRFMTKDPGKVVLTVI